MQNSLPQSSPETANAQPGLSAYFHPMAQQLQSHGRNGDTMLVHMTPGEVHGLQQLAMAHGGSLTINPHTGLPEANFLKKLLPTILGVALNFIPGVGPLMSAALVAGGYGLATGSLKKGLMAGLQAYGGAGIGAGLAKIGTAAAGAAGQAATQGLGYQIMGEAAKTAATQGAPGMLAQAAPVANMIGGEIAKEGVSQAAQAGAKEIGKQTLGQAIKSNALNAGAGLKALGSQAMTNPIEAAKLAGSNFSGAIKADPWLKSAPFLQGIAPTVAGSGAFSGITSAMQPDMPEYSAPEDEKWNYEGPYVMPPRQVSYPGADEEGSGEHLYFNPSNPVPGYVPLKSLSPEQRKAYGYADGGLAALPASEEFKKLVAFYNAKRPGPITASIKPVKPEKKASTTTSSTASTNASTTSAAPTTVTVNPEILNPSVGRYGEYVPGGGWGRDSVNVQTVARGGHINMGDGAFVVDARTVSELGNGSSNAGIEHLQRMGGQPVRGPGDGVSDSVPARIGGRQEARVARDEVIFSPQAVNRMGGGSNRRGANKLYAMMDKAHAARKRASRGTDTKLRRGLA